MREQVREVTRVADKGGYGHSAHACSGPLEWLAAMGFHIAVVAALIVVPLYSSARCFDSL
jgi:hypothetical protein